MAKSSDGVLLELGAVRKLKRQYEQSLLTCTNLVRRLATLASARHQDAHMPPDGVPFVNDASEFVPPWGVMRVTGVDAKHGGLKINKPNTTLERLYLVNGPREIKAGSPGIGTWLTSTGRTARDRFVSYNEESGTPAHGETWGPKPGQWTLEKHFYGFLIQGGNKSVTINYTDILDSEPVTYSLTVAVQSEVHRVLAKLDGSLAQGSSATASVWKRTSAGTGWEDSGQDITVYDWNLNTGESIDADTKFIAEFAGNCWIATGPYCAADDV